MDTTIASDGRAAIARNAQALRRVLAGLVVMARMSLASRSDTKSPQTGFSSERPHNQEATAEGRAGAATLPRHLYLAILRLLRPAESAARRLIIACSRGMTHVAAPLKARTALPRNYAGIVYPPGFRPSGARAALPAPTRRPTFPLLDPLHLPERRGRPAAASVPRICVPGLTERRPVPVRLPPSPGDPIETARLAGRLAALASALDDLPGQARRFARWRAIRLAARAKQAEGNAGPTRRVWPLRMGRPPGSRPARRRRDRREVDEILAHAHSLALFALDYPDTS